MKKQNVKKYCFIGFFILAAAILAGATAVFLDKPTLVVDPQIGRAIQPPLDFPRFNLIDQRGRPFDNTHLTGHWSIAMIGFTYCPDVCPTTVSNIAAFIKRLGSHPGDDRSPKFVFFSVDPFRDTPDVLSNYIEYYNEDFIGVTGKPERILDLVTELGLSYAYTDPEVNRILEDVAVQPALEEYGVIHSTRLLFISPESKLVASMSWPYTPESILAFYQKLLKYYGD